MCVTAKAESGELNQVFLVHDECPSSTFGCVYLIRLPNVGAIAVDVPAVLVMQSVKEDETCDALFFTMTRFNVPGGPGWGPSVYPGGRPFGLVEELTLSGEIALKAHG